MYNSFEPSNYQINLLIESFLPLQTYLYPLMPIFHPLRATSFVNTDHVYMFVCSPGRTSCSGFLLVKPNYKCSTQSTSPTTAIPLTPSHSLQEGLCHIPTMISPLSMTKSESAVKSFVGHILSSIGGHLDTHFLGSLTTFSVQHNFKSPTYTPPTSNYSSESCSSLSSWGFRVVGPVIMIFICELASASPGRPVKTPISGAHPQVSVSKAGWRMMIWTSNKFPGYANFRSHILRTIDIYKQCHIKNSLALKRVAATLI